LKEVNRNQAIIRFIVIALLFLGSYFALSIFFDAFILKIPTPLKIFPQLYFAVGYLFVSVGLYLLIITLRTFNIKGVKA